MEGGAEDTGEGLDLGVTPGACVAALGDGDHAGGGEGDEAAGKEGEQRDEEQVRELGVEELLGIPDPRVEDLAEEATFSKPTGADKNSKKIHVQTPT